MFNSDGMHVLDVAPARDRLMITVETDAVVTGCPVCGVVATGHRRRRVPAAEHRASGWRCSSSS